MTGSAACIGQHGIAIRVADMLIAGISYEVGLGVGQAASKEWRNISQAFRLNVGRQIFVPESQIMGLNKAVQWRHKDIVALAVT
jgi:hypothetical protein